MSLPAWARALKQFNEAQERPNKGKDDDSEESNYEERLGLATAKLLTPLNASQSNESNSKLSKVPRFFDANRTSICSVDALDGLNKEEEQMRRKRTESLLAVSEITRELFLDNHEERLLSEHDLDCLFKNLVDLIKQYGTTQDRDSNNKTTSTKSEHYWMSYEIFRELKQSLPSRAHKFFTPSVFRKFPMNARGEIRGLSFHQFVSYALNLLHQYITLCRYDITSLSNTNSSNHSSCGWNGKSYLTESDLEIFVSDQLEMIPSLAQIDEAFHAYYIYHTVRRFVFCLSPEINNNTKPIAIGKIVCSDCFREFNEFRFAKANSAKLRGRGIDDDDDDGEDGQMLQSIQKLLGQSQDVEEQRTGYKANNWFSCENALRVYKMYLQLDADHNGTLSLKEMLQFNGSTMSNLCIQRIFQYKKTWDGEMDYKGFLNFVLATENKQHLAALNYWWEILDLDGNGYLTPLTLHTLYRSVQKKMGIFGLDPINCEDVVTEIIDMVHPNDVDKITKRDLLRSKMYHTVIDILTDVKGFWEYENRESIMVDQQS